LVIVLQADPLRNVELGTNLFALNCIACFTNTEVNAEWTLWNGRTACSKYNEKMHTKSKWQTYHLFNNTYNGILLMTFSRVIIGLLKSALYILGPFPFQVQTIELLWSQIAELEPCT